MGCDKGADARLQKLQSVSNVRDAQGDEAFAHRGDLRLGALIAAVGDSGNTNASAHSTWME
jgi:hypothetical protein